MSSSNFGTFARSKTRKFPPQAIDEILSFVHDLDTLKSCTLVCRDWESTAQLYLFSVVHVGGHPPPRRHSPYDIPHPLIPLNELHTFRLQGFIRELRILQSPGNAFLQQLQVILDNGDFRRLKTVMLDQTSLTMTGATMAQVQKLLLSNIRFSGPNGLLALDLSRFSSLEDLLFEGITFLPSTLGPPVNTPPPLQLKTLVIQSCTNDVYATLIDTLLLDQSPVNIKHLSRFDNHDNQLIYIADPLDPNARIPCPDTLSMASRAVGHLLKENNIVQHIGLHNVPGQTELLTPTFLCGLRSLVVPMKTLQLESLQNLCNLLTESKPSASGPLTLILKYPYFTADILRCGHEWIFLDNLAGSHVVKLAIFMEYPDDVCSLEETLQVAGPLQFEQLLSRSMANAAFRLGYVGLNTIDDFLGW